MTTIPGTNLGIKEEMERTWLLGNDDGHETCERVSKYYFLLWLLIDKAYILTKTGIMEILVLNMSKGYVITIFQTLLICSVVSGKVDGEVSAATICLKHKDLSEGGP